VDFYRQRGTRAHIQAIVLVEITAAAPLISPAYDDGASEAEIRSHWEGHYAELHRQWTTTMDQASDT
jgi:hypothetical protein